MPAKFRIKTTFSAKEAKLKTLPDLGALTTTLGISLRDLTNGTLREMEQVINSSRKRPRAPGKTDSLIHALRGSLAIRRVGVGRIVVSLVNRQYLDSVAPYWYVLNYGGRPWPDDFVTQGIFSDGRPKRGGRGHTWIEGGTGPRGGMYKMKPMKPIQGIRYLNSGIQYLDKSWPRIMSAIRNVIRKGTNVSTREGYEDIIGKVERAINFVPGALANKKKILTRKRYPSGGKGMRHQIGRGKAKRSKRKK